LQYSDYRIEQVFGRDRCDIVQFMSSQFYRHFDAQLNDDTQEVYSVRSIDGHLLAAFGLNRRVDEFFCRHYVQDVRHTLQGAVSAAIDPKSILEISHLSVVEARTVCRLIPSLAAFLAEQANYVVCTATRTLAKLFIRRGLAPHKLGMADQNQLPLELRQGWGDYYDHEPMVLGGDVTLAAECLAEVAAAGQRSA